jgi:hypothetical protein
MLLPCYISPYYLSCYIVRKLLRFHRDLVSRINEPAFSLKSPAVHVARTNLDMLDPLLAHGADLNVRTSWDNGGFSVLEQVNPEQAAPTSPASVATPRSWNCF